MTGENSRTSGSHISLATIAAAVAVVEIVVIVAAAPAGIAAVIVTARIVPSGSCVNGLHRDLGSGLGRGVEGLRPGVILGPELNCRLHGDLGLLCEAMAAVGWRGAAVAWWRCVV